MVPFIQPCPVLMRTSSPTLKPLVSAWVAGAAARPAPVVLGADDCALESAVSATSASATKNPFIVPSNSLIRASQARYGQELVVRALDRSNVLFADTLDPPAEDHERDAGDGEDHCDREERADGQRDVAEELQMLGRCEELLLLGKQQIRIARAARFQASDDALFVEPCKLTMRSRWHQAHDVSPCVWLAADGCLGNHCAGNAAKLSPVDSVGKILLRHSSGFCPVLGGVLRTTERIVGGNEILACRLEPAHGRRCLLGDDVVASLQLDLRLGRAALPKQRSTELDSCD